MRVLCPPPTYYCRDTQDYGELSLELSTFMRKPFTTLAALLMLTFGLAPSASAQLAGRSAEEWIQTLETPTRVASLKIPETVAALKLKPGQIVADIGAGSGLFSIP